jgi:hypothetical protein
MYRSAEFRDYFVNGLGKAPSTFNTYNSFLNRIDREIGGLDEKIQEDGIDAVLAWGRSASSGPFEDYPSHARSVLKSYLQFALNNRPGEDAEDFPEETIEGDEATGTVFKLEREMQAAVRKQLSTLEHGLAEADGGNEVRVATGRVDILARATNGDLVVIELKAGDCPPGAMEQVLGYAEALADERGARVRAYLIAASFPDRVRAAAKRVRDLELRTYEFSMRFHTTS